MKVPHVTKVLLAASLLTPMAMVAPAASAEPAVAQARPTSAKICLNCHKAESNNLRGHWESVAMKSLSLQLKIDDRSEVLKFDKGTVQVLNAGEKGDIEKQLRSIKKGHEVRIEFTEKDGVKYAKTVAAKPPIKLSEQEKVSLAEVEKLVAQGPEKANYTLIDSRPAPRFKEGAIPTAISLPFPEFDKLVDRLPLDKNRLIVFYCSGVTCNMSPSSQKKAKALGYTNVKVFVEGMPGWLGKNYGVVAVKNLQDAYKDIPFVLLDARAPKAAGKGFIKGAVTFPVADEKTVKSLPKKEQKAPLIIYDENGKGNAVSVARNLIKAGYGNVQLLNGGVEAWREAKLPLESGNLETRVTYVPKPKPGEIPIEQFRALMAAIPADTILVDVRNADEIKEGMIKGAMNIPADEVDQHLAELKDKKVVTYCNTGTRAEMAYHTLKGKGVGNVLFLNAKVDIDGAEVEITK